MSRIPSSTDFHVDVEGIGRFTFAKRVMRDMYRIRGEYNQMTAGNYDADGNSADLSALGFVTIQCLLVAEPSGFSMEDLDPEDKESDDKVMKIFLALRAKEGSFRAGRAQPKQEERKEPSAQLRDDVPPSVQPAAD